MRITAEKYEESTGQRLVRADPPQGVFELSIAMAGAVSAGAYSAGVLDFLIEALDAWEHARGQVGIPSHRVHLVAMTGASAGSMVAAITAACLDHDFPHGTVNANPLYDLWVNRIDIASLLQAHDLSRDQGRIMSLLDCTVLDELAAQAIAPSPLRRQAPLMRPWLGSCDGAPLKLLFTQNNLLGVPFQARMTGGHHSLCLHADHIRFSYGRTTVKPRPDEYLLDPAQLATGGPRPLWQYLVTHALGSGAFPVGLRHRELIRWQEDYLHRYFDAGDKEVIWLRPQELNLGSATPHDTVPGPHEPQAYNYVCSDGGTLNNEPFQFAHEYLAGLGGRNVRTGKGANRAVLMIDPFMDDARWRFPDGDEQLVDILQLLPGAWKDQARFSSQDRMLAEDDDIYSRYIIAPADSEGLSLGRPHNARQLASGGLGAFSGFLHREFRLHDFELGRYNAQRFLSEHLAVPPDNAWLHKFAGVARTTKGELPIIPLIGHLAKPLPRPNWPVDRFDDAGFHGLAKGLSGRLTALGANFLERETILGGSFAQWLARRGTRCTVDWIMRAVHDDLTRSGLMRRGLSWKD